MQSVRGTKDWLTSDCETFNFIICRMKHIMKLYNIQEISVPILENAELFSSSVGESSDIVSREMYSVKSNNPDRDSRENIILRPESTTSVVRFLQSNNLMQTMPQKLFVYGPMFRYERPQKGRLRQMHQFSVEYFGLNHPFTDAEVIKCAYECLQSLVGNLNIRLEINSLGDAESRKNYRDALVEFFTKNQDLLSQDSTNKINTNPLRILDSKNEKDQEIIKNAPNIENYLTLSSKKKFNDVLKYLNIMSIDFVINNRLVRGLDYYTDTVFEFKLDSFGAQSTLLGGGRYDLLCHKMFNKDIHAIGWSMGIDRMMILIKEIGGFFPPTNRKIAIAVFSDLDNQELMIAANHICELARKNNITSEIICMKKLSDCLKKANQREISECIIIGPDEIIKRQCIIKNMTNNEETLVDIDDIQDYLQKTRI